MARKEQKVRKGTWSIRDLLTVRTREPVPIEQLMEEQGIAGPQGLSMFDGLEIEWTDADDVILELVD